MGNLLLRRKFYPYSSLQLKLEQPYSLNVPLKTPAFHLCLFEIQPLSNLSNLCTNIGEM